MQINPYHLSLQESSVEKLHRLRQRTQDMQIQLGMAKSVNHINQVSDNALKELENHGQVQRLSAIDWKEKLEKIRQRTQRIQEELTQANQSCEIALEIADHDLRQAEDVVQNVTHIKSQQKDFDQQMLSVQQDFADISTRTIILSKRNEDLSQNIEGHSLNESREGLNSLQSNVESIASNFSQIKLDQIQIIGQCDEMNERMQAIESNQKQMEKTLDAEIERQDSQQALDEFIMSTPIQEIYTNMPSFTFIWEGIRLSRDKITAAFSEFAQSEAVMMFKYTTKNLCDIVWTYINISPITGIALGVFGTCFTLLSLRFFPIETLVIGGGLFIVTKVVVMPIIAFVNS